MSTKFIDIRGIIGSKNPMLLRVLPGALIQYLRRILHEDEVNWVLEQYGHKQGVDFVASVLETFQVTYSLSGLERAEPQGRYLFAANHPLGGLDGMILLHAIGTKFPSVKAPVNDLLLNLPPLRPMFLPINKHGGQSLQNARLLDQAYASDDQILYFPAGLCSRKQGGEILDLEWKKSFITKAIQHKRSVVPVHVGGQNSKFFYNLARFRAALGIKVNVEMLYLADEMFRQKGQNIHLIFGAPIPYTHFDLKHRNAQWWAQWVKGRVYALPQGGE